VFAQPNVSHGALAQLADQDVIRNLYVAHRCHAPAFNRRKALLKFMSWSPLSPQTLARFGEIAKNRDEGGARKLMWGVLSYRITLGYQRKRRWR